jgi:hypothetical protein
MIRRPLRRYFDTSNMPKVLEALRVARFWLGQYSAAQKFGSPERAKCDAFFQSMDDVAETLTGDRTYFHAPFHHTGLFMRKKEGE